MRARTIFFWHKEKGNRERMYFSPSEAPQLVPIFESGRAAKNDAMPPSLSFEAFPSPRPRETVPSVRQAPLPKPETLPARAVAFSTKPPGSPPPEKGIVVPKHVLITLAVLFGVAFVLSELRFQIRMGRLERNLKKLELSYARHLEELHRMTLTRMQHPPPMWGGGGVSNIGTRYMRAAFS